MAPLAPVSVRSRFFAHVSDHPRPDTLQESCPSQRHLPKDLSCRLFTLREQAVAATQTESPALVEAGMNTTIVMDQLSFRCTNCSKPPALRRAGSDAGPRGRAGSARRLGHQESRDGGSSAHEVRFTFEDSGGAAPCSYSLTISGCSTSCSIWCQIRGGFDLMCAVVDQIRDGFEETQDMSFDAPGSGSHRPRRYTLVVGADIAHVGVIRAWFGVGRRQRPRVSGSQSDPVLADCADFRPKSTREICVFHTRLSDGQRFWGSGQVKVLERARSGVFSA